jgi:exopolyphosphatase/guanosine-5'-triphosphate,3'-diphosphate pyrophosphatase
VKAFPRGLISIGTNSTRLLVLHGDAVTDAQSVGTRLGRGLGPDGKLDPAARERTLETIAAYVAALRAHRATVDVIATSALRRADDAADFGRAVAALAGVEPRIISGDDEAAYSFAGAMWGVGAAGRVGVLDVGGGSTELAVGAPGAVERTTSLEIGAVRLSERFPALMGERSLERDTRRNLVDAARGHVRAILAPLAAFDPFDELLAVGGTAFTAAAMLCGDPARDGVEMDRTARCRLIDDLLARELDARRAMAHIRPQRADILPAGLIIVDTACALLAKDRLRVSHADLLAGYLRSPHYRAHAVPAANAG